MCNNTGSSSEDVLRYAGRASVRPARAEGGKTSALVFKSEASLVMNVECTLVLSSDPVRSTCAVQVGKFSFMANSRARSVADTEGLVKFVSDAKTDKILGVHIMGPNAGELISECVLVRARSLVRSLGYGHLPTVWRVFSKQGRKALMTRVISEARHGILPQARGA